MKDNENIVKRLGINSEEHGDRMLATLNGLASLHSDVKMMLFKFDKVLLNTDNEIYTTLTKLDKQLDPIMTQHRHNRLATLILLGKKNEPHQSENKMTHT